MRMLPVRIGAIGLLGLVIGIGCLNHRDSHVLSASEMNQTAGSAVVCVDKIPQTNCTSEFSACIESAGAEACAVLGCTKCTTDAAYSDCTNTGGTKYESCTVTVTAGGCGTIRTAPCTIQESKCKCGTYVGTTNACAKREVTATKKCPE